MLRAQIFAALAISLLALPARAQAPTASSSANQATAAGCGPHCETFGSPTAPVTVIFFHGASGAENYRKMAQRVAGSGYYVLFPRYQELHNSPNATDADYAAWTALVDSIVRDTTAGRPGKPVVAFGVSRGASVALAAGAENPSIAAVIDWSGSLPDEAFHNATRVPPLLILHGSDDSSVPVRNAEQLIQLCQLAGQHCESQIYNGDTHVFPNHLDDAWQRTFAFLQTTSAGKQPAAREMPEID